jgi:uncharacterized protein YhaN
MHIQRLHIGDFGILRNQTLENIHPGLVVIGGPNRAGKSTFMQVLRFLGYGIPSGGSLPPANVEYMVEVDINDEETRNEYHIRLEGQSEPVCIISGKGERIPIGDLYRLDAFTYHNLFTISLDQLTVMPKGVTKNELDKLQAALLGAGFKDIADIPRLEEVFFKAASAIGGTTGRLRNKGFRPHVQFIREGVNKKKKALSQVEEYQRHQTHLSYLTDKEEKLDSELKANYIHRDLLEAVKGNYDMLVELTELEHQLSQHKGGNVPQNLPLKNQPIVEALYESYQDLIRERERANELLADGLPEQKDIRSLMDLLLRHRTALQKHFDKLSGLEVRWDHLRDLMWNLEESRQDIIEGIQGLHKSWTGEDIGRIRALPLEFIEESRIMELVSRSQKVENQLERINSHLDETQIKVKELENQKAEWEKHNAIPGLKNYFWSSAISLILGLVLSLIHLPAGLLVGLFGILGAALIAFYRGMSQKDAQIRLKDIRAQLHSSLEQLDKLQGNKSELTDDLNTIEAKLTEVSDMLGLEEVPSPVSLMEYYRGITAIQERIRRLDRQENDLSEQLTVLSTQFQELCLLLSEFENVTCLDGTRELLNPETWIEIQSAVRKWHHKLQVAISINNLTTDIGKAEVRIRQLTGLMEEGNEEDQLETQIESYIKLCQLRSDFLEKENRRMYILQSLERIAGSKVITEALDENILNSPQEKEPLQVLLNVFYEYPARESIEREYEEIILKIKELEEGLESCKKEIQKTNFILGQLSLTDQLEQAHAMIHKGRSGLYQESYQYAVYKTAAWLCREIRNGFLEKTKDELLLQGEDILKQLTGGIYRRILPKEDLSDFSFALENGAIQDNSTVLSRATAEQVFLSIRLGRILDSNTGLPVIIDDSLVNFDAAHLKRALAVIARLSQSHQVFLMTCHPHLIGLLMDMGIYAQYWMLENGRFTLTDGPILRETLHFSSLSC